MKLALMVISLRLAVTARRPDILDYLLEHGQSPNDRRIQMNCSALQFALVMNYPDILRILMKHGADAHSRDEFGLEHLRFLNYCSGPIDPKLQEEASTVDFIFCSF